MDTKPPADIHDRLDAVLELTNSAITENRDLLAAELLRLGECTLERWLSAKGREPTENEVEGYRLLALHRQGATGDPSFNACRETCRELVFLHNCIRMRESDADLARHVRLAAMVLRHLVLFIDGKLENSGLGEFCCSSRPIRNPESQDTQLGQI